MSEDCHTLAARALLARLSDEPDWTSALAAALRDAVAAGLERAAEIADADAQSDGRAWEARWAGIRIAAVIRAAAD